MTQLQDNVNLRTLNYDQTFSKSKKIQNTLNGVSLQNQVLLTEINLIHNNQKYKDSFWKNLRTKPNFT